MAVNKKSLLARGLHDRLIVKFTRPFEPGSVRGYVLDIGLRFFLMAIFGDGFHFDGFQCIRLSDVRKLKVPDRYAGVAEAVLRKRREKVPRKPPVVLRNIKALLLTANRAFPLVTIHIENVDPDVCYIGHVVEVSANRLSLLEINPDASWEKEPTTYRLSEITRVDFGGDYEAGLHLVGGLPSDH